MDDNIQILAKFNSGELILNIVRFLDITNVKITREIKREQIVYLAELTILSPSLEYYNLIDPDPQLIIILEKAKIDRSFKTINRYQFKNATCRIKTANKIIIEADYLTIL